MDTPAFRLASTVLGTPDPSGLAQFYVDLLGWRHREEPEDDWVVIKPDGDPAVARAEELGARQAAHQPQDDVRVMLDPAGHPFCLFAPGG